MYELSGSLRACNAIRSLEIEHQKDVKMESNVVKNGHSYARAILTSHGGYGILSVSRFLRGEEI